MTQDEILSMARDAGMEVHPRKDQIRIGYARIAGLDSTPEVMRFAALVAAKAAAEEREETKELRVALDFLAGLHPHLTIDGPPMAVAERIFDAVMGEQAELKARLASYERNMESLRAHLAKHSRQGASNAS